MEETIKTYKEGKCSDCGGETCRKPITRCRKCYFLNRKNKESPHVPEQAAVRGVILGRKTRRGAQPVTGCQKPCVTSVVLNLDTGRGGRVTR